MGKKRSEKLKENFTKNYLPQFKEFFQDWDIKVMSYVMVVVIMIAMIAATVAWFTHMTSVRAAGLGITTGSSDSLKVEVKQKENSEAEGNGYFVEVQEGEEDMVLVDLEMPVFDNVETYTVSGNGVSVSSSKTVNKLAPGVYGSVTIRLTALRQDVDHFTLTPGVLMTYIDGSGSADSDAGSAEETNSGSGEENGTGTVNVTGNGNETGGNTNTLTEEIKTELKNLSQGHILFFENRAEIVVDENAHSTSIITEGNTSLTDKNVNDFVHCDKYVFYNTSVNNTENSQYMPLSLSNPLEGRLEWNTQPDKNEGKPNEITLYWYWPYEYANLGTQIGNKIKLSKWTESSNLINDETKPYFDEERMKEMDANNISWDETQLYDYGDTKLGTYVKSMKLHFEVKGYHEEGQAQTTTSP